MSIKSIKIRNFKSIESIDLNFDDKTLISCFLGKNGVGKTNVFAAMNYFYLNLENVHVGNVVDSVNTYNSSCEISVMYDFSNIIPKLNTQHNEELHEELKLLAKDCVILRKSRKLVMNKIKLTLKQDKNGKITWNQDLKVRKIIAKLFPLYIINTRKLDLITWEKIWDTINDLASDYPKVSDEKVVEILDTAFESIYNKYEKSKKFVEKLFKDNQIALDKYHNIQRFKYMFMTIFGGEDFLNDGKNLDFYSDGINSFLYIKLLFSIICHISSLSCKSPLILLDEPEIGLHEAKIEELVDVISNTINKNVFVLINTHSPKIILELIANDNKINIYRLFLKKSHTQLRCLDVNWLRSLRHVITTKETSCYFSDYLLFVEGESEYQLFKNKNLRKLFPFINKIHIYPYGSNNAIIKYVCPLYVNIGIPYVTILDIDKIIKFKKNKDKYFAYTSSEELNPLKSIKINKQDKLRYFSPKKETKKSLQLEFKRLVGKDYSFKNGYNYVDDSNYEKLIYIAKKLCEYNNVSVNSTTIEGLLINPNNVDLFIEFCLEHYSNKKDIVLTIKGIPDTKEKTALLRLFFEGNLDFSTKKLISTSTFKSKQTIIETKADGWVDKWINWFIDKMCSEDDVEEAEEVFKKHFPELFDTLQMIKYMI